MHNARHHPTKRITSSLATHDTCWRNYRRRDSMQLVVPEPVAAVDLLGARDSNAIATHTWREMACNTILFARKGGARDGWNSNSRLEV